MGFSTVSYWRCNGCGSANRRENWTCNRCGKRWSFEGSYSEFIWTWRCTKCGLENRTENSTCNRCGRNRYSIF